MNNYFTNTNLYKNNYNTDKSYENKNIVLFRFFFF